MASRRMPRIGAFRVGTAAAVFLLLAVSAGCINPFGRGTEHFLITVNSIAAPDTIAPGDTLTARFSGAIGPDGCSGLDRVERSRSAGLIELRFHGVRSEGGGDCLQHPVALDHVEEILPPVEDPFMIRVRQPDGSVLEKVVRVR